MKNLPVSELLNEIADYLEFADDMYRVRAYRKAALVIEGLSEDIEQVWKEKRLEELPGIGEGIAKKIDEFLRTGKLRHLEKLKKKTPVDMEGLGRIEGVGPKTIIKLYKELRIKTVADLEKAAKKGKIRNIEGLGPIAEHNILKSIEFAKKTKDRIPLGFALSSAEEVIKTLGTLKEVDNAGIAGSTRRMKETIGDIDILATSKAPAKVMDFFTKMPNVADVLAKGETKASVRLKEGIQVDLRVLDDRIFGAALLYFTGNKEHNIILRRIAVEKGLKLSEYGLFDRKTGRLAAGRTEEEVYKKLGMDYIEPEMREDEGEIEMAQHHMLPKLVGYDEIKGDLQMHTKWSDGSNSIEEMALAAKKLGHEYICITDHTGKLAIANALDEKRIARQKKEIAKVNKKLIGIKVLQGTEVNIKDDGTPDMDNKVLKQFDIVIAAIHSGFKNTKEKATKRIIKAMENENVDIIAHPTGRLITKRESYEIDLDAVFDAAKRTGTILEINSYPERMDLRDFHVRAAVKAGVKLAINTDAHNADQLKFMRLGIGTARRGWATKKDIINTRSLKGMMGMVKKSKSKSGKIFK
ncbi:DNA polymerase/3'-5' exonuclease PolX [Candidatus Woesearchaeota archaeon]|nr:DNA polymerase/3'-5' exonuclease PolX [Candidatus Woesearchaeota archaeon]